MMRTALMLKNFAHVVMALGIILAVQHFHLASFEFWATILISFLLWLVLRLIAIVGQLVYEMRNDSLRVMANIERSLFQANATAQEIRDLLDKDAEK